jgi:hypothetical protein
VAIRQIEVAVEYDESPEDALEAISQIVTVLGLDIERDTAEFASGTSDEGYPVITALLAARELDEVGNVVPR